MNRSLTASFGVHGALLLLVLFGLPNSKLDPIVQQQAVQVDISNIGDVTKVKATTTQDVPKQDKPAPPKTEVTKDEPPAPKVDDKVVEAAKEKQPDPPQPDPVPKPEPKPEPKKVEDKPVEDTQLADMLKAQEVAEKKAAEEAALAEKKAAEEQKKKEAEAKKKAEEQKKLAEAKKKAEEEKKKKKLDMAALEKFLNKENDQRTAPQKASDQTGNPDKGQTDAQGSDAEVAATLIDALRSKLAQCWTVPPGAREANISVKVQFSLRRDKSVEGLPVIVSGGGDPLSDATAQSAISAVMECAPYDFLPDDRYDMWQDNTVSFTPDMMSGTG
jgi:TolA protein